MPYFPAPTPLSGLFNPEQAAPGSGAVVVAVRQPVASRRPVDSRHAALSVPVPACSSRYNPLQIAGRIKPQTHLHQYHKQSPQRTVTNLLPASPRPLQIVTTVSQKCPKLQFHPINIFSIFQHFFKTPQKSPPQALWRHSQNNKIYTLRIFTPGATWYQHTCHNSPPAPI